MLHLFVWQPKQSCIRLYVHSRDKTPFDLTGADD